MSQPEALYKPAIVKNGFAFVLLPLIGATAILCCLHLLWLSADRISAEERRQSEVVGLLNGIFNNWSTIDNCYMGLLGEHSEVLRQTGKNNEQLMQGSFSQMKQKRQNEPAKLVSLEKLSALIEKECALMATLPATTNAPDTPSLLLMKQMPAVLLQTYKLRGEVRQLLESEWLALRSDREDAEKTQGTVRTLLYGATIFNIVGGIGLAFLFSSVMAKRISQLSDNAELLHKNKPLKERLHGDDELSYLDLVLHDVEKRLNDAREHRQWILSMVAHDMRSPLMSARANLQIMEEIGDDYPEQGVDELQRTYKLLDSVLQFVHGLLAVQQELDAISTVSTIPATTVSSSVSRVQEPSSDISRSSVLERATFLRPGVVRQSLVLMLCPLLFQMLLFFLIDRQLLATEKTMTEQGRCGDIAVCSDMILTDMIRGSSMQAAYLMTQAPALAERAKATFDLVLKDYEKLLRVCGANPEWRKFVVLSKVADQEKISRLLSASSSELDDAAALFMEIGEVKTKSAAAVRLRALQRTLFAENLERWNEEDSRRAKLEKFVGLAIGLSFLVNLAFALFLLLFFARTTNARMQALMRNALMLGKHKQLEPCLSGADEIANLDVAIHEANERLEASSNERSLIVSGLAKDIEKPLKRSLEHIESFEICGKDALTDKSRHYIKLAEDAIRRVFSLVGELLTLEALEIGKVALVVADNDAFSLASESIGAVSGLAAQKQIVIENRCSSWRFRGDRERVSQILINYLGNAIKFSPPGSTISVAAEQLTGCIRFTVLDAGPGIDSESRERVFERYFQSNSEQRAMGFGLGLAICKLLVELHGGKLGVESQPGQGSCFWFDIPAGTGDV